MTTRAPPPELAGGPPSPAVAAPPTAVQTAAAPPVANGVMAPIPNPPGPRAERGPPPPPAGYVPNPSFSPPPPASAGSYASGPVEVVAMRPIPNPGDLSPAERRRVYGPGRNYRLSHAPAHRSAARPAPRHAAPVARAPVARPPVTRAPVAPTVVAKAPPAKIVAPQAAAPVKPAPATAVVAAPAVATPPVAAKPTTAQGMIGQLQATVGGAVARGSTLTVGPEIAQGKPGAVSLTLPASLLETLKAEAAKLGLSKPARKADVEATLSGDGYTVTPNGKQTAALKAGEAARFDWQVAPAGDAQGPLQADVNAVLTGQGKHQTLTLASIQSAVAAKAVQAEAKPGFKFKMPHLPKLSFLGKLPVFGKKDAAEVAGPPPAPDVAQAPPVAAKQPLLRERTLPIVGRVSGRTQAAAGLAALAVLILALVSRGMADNRRVAERRRRYRTYQPMAMDESPAAI